ncbi:MAG: 2-hydroxyacid dehydrogenase [Variibacter sp.]|nr:2-hydroxyacid dehydrogenase [Variibacter sp.]
MADEKPAVLFLGPPKKHILAGLEEEFTVHAVVHPKDLADDLVARLAPHLRFVAVGGPPGGADGALMQRFGKLEIVASFGVGYDNIDAQWAAAHGVIVTNTPDVLTEEVADTAIGLLLCTVRELPRAERYLRAGEWARKGDYRLTASLRDRTVGLVGLGRIGQAIARRLEAMRVPVVYHARRPRPEAPYPYFPSLIEMARAVDVLLVITPGGAETRHLIDAKVLEALGPNGILINMARGSVVDERALIAALKERKILSAGLDVFADEPLVPQELIDMDHVVLLPHVGSASEPTRRAMERLVVDNLVRWKRGEPPLTPVPETPWPPKRA